MESNRHPRTFYPKDQPIRSSTAIDGEDWDIVVPDDYSSIQVAGNTAEESIDLFIICMNKPWKKYV